MRIWLIIDTISSCYCWQWMGHDDHEYHIYRDQQHQHSTDTTSAHHHWVMHRGIQYLLTQGVDHIICPPTIELQYAHLYPQILTIFTQYIAHTLNYSTVGKVGFVWSITQCQDINLHWWDITFKHLSTPRQVSNRHYNYKLPLWTSIDKNLTQRLDQHKPDHFIANHMIKSLLRPLKDAHVDTAIWLDWAYYACDVSLSHHCRSIKRHRSTILQSILYSLIFDAWVNPSGVNSKTWYNVTIHHTWTLRDLKANKKIRRLLARGKNTEIQQINID